MTEALRERIRACTNCPLHEVENGPVPFSGPVPAYLAVVGEAPGLKEAESLKPFVGPAGQRMREAIRGAGMDPELVFWCNSISCWPKRELVTPKPSELKACAQNLADQLSLANPTWVILAGNIALQSQRKDLKISHTRGKVLVPPGQKWKFFVTYHPSYALRSIQGDKTLRQDLKTLVQMMDAQLEMAPGAEHSQGWVPFNEDSCVVCGTSPEVLGQHDKHLRFDSWEAPYCDACWQFCPDEQARVRQEQKEQAEVDRSQRKTGRLF